MGHSEIWNTEEHGTAYQTTNELNRNKNNMEGLLELISFTRPSQDKQEPSTKVTNTFSHFGIIVPDVKAAQDRFDQFGWPILARAGDQGAFPAELLNSYGLGELPLDDPEAARRPQSEPSPKEKSIGYWGRPLLRFTGDPFMQMQDVIEAGLEYEVEPANATTRVGRSKINGFAPEY